MCWRRRLGGCFGGSRGVLNEPDCVVVATGIKRTSSSNLNFVKETEMLKHLTFVLLSSVTTLAFAQDAGWFHIATSSDGNDDYSVKMHSGELTQNKDGQIIEVIVGQVSHKRAQTVEVVKWYVATTDCAQGYGDLVILDIDGNYEGKTAFAQGGKNIASGIASIICAAAKSNGQKSVGGNA